MAQLSGPTQSAGQPLYTSSATAFHALGERMLTADGRKFVYVKAGDTALVAGNWIQSAAELSNHQNLTPVAASIGATYIDVALGATAATANQYAGGMAVVTVTPGLGQGLVISGHAAAALSTTLRVYLADPLRVALTTSSRIDLVPNPYSAVIQSPVTTLTGVPVGVAPYVIAAGEYGWLQTGGLGAALIAGTPAVGSALVLPGSAAGAAVVDPANAATPIVGIQMSTGGNGETNGVLIMLP